MLHVKGLCYHQLTQPRQHPKPVSSPRDKITVKVGGFQNLDGRILLQLHGYRCTTQISKWQAGLDSELASGSVWTLDEYTHHYCVLAGFLDTNVQRCKEATGMLDPKSSLFRSAR